MKLVSDTLKEALKKTTTQRKGRILINGNYYEVYNVEYYADSYQDGNVIGNAIASQIDFDLPYMNKFDTFKYYDGVWTGNDYEYVDMGTFHVFDEKDQDEFNKHITAFDNLIKFNAPFVPDENYPKTLYEELQNVCQQAGVELATNNIANGSFTIENNQFVNNENLKEVLRNICGISGTYAIIKEDKLHLILRTETSEKITKKDHKPMEWKRKTYGINQVILGMADVEGEYVLKQDDDDIAKNGVHKLVINDNYFAYTTEKRLELIEELFEQVKGFGYVPFEMVGEWLNYLDIGDTINIDDVDTIVLRINGKSPNALESTISSPAIIDSAVEYANNTSDILDTFKNYRITVDKHEGLITQIASETEKISIKTDNNSTEINNNYQELIKKFDDTASLEDLEMYQKTMQTQMDANKLEISNIQTVLIDGVEKVKTTSGTFDENGLTMEQTGAKTKSVLNESGVNVIDTQGSNVDLLYAGYVDEEKAGENDKLASYEGQTVVYSNNMIVDNYLSIGKHSRIEDYEDGTGVFYIGG